MKSKKTVKSVLTKKKTSIDKLKVLAVKHGDLQEAQGMGTRVILTTNWSGFFDGSLFGGKKGSRFNEFDIAK